MNANAHKRSLPLTFACDCIVLTLTPSNFFLNYLGDTPRKKSPLTLTRDHSLA